MIAATIGSIGHYIESKEFETYVDRVELFFDANSINDGKKVSTFLSLSTFLQAYCQLKLAESAKDLTVINTHRGLFRYNRLCFGISSAPGIFQRAMEQLMQGLPGTLCYLDDILVCGSNEFEHNSRLEKDLGKLQNA